MISSMLSILLLATLLSGFFPTIVNGYSFYIADPPRQCQNLSFAITGFGTPPYSVTIVPIGATPLPNGIEVREVLNQNFTGGSTALSFQLPWPQNSQFVAVVSIICSITIHESCGNTVTERTNNSSQVSDALGFGTGGTSVPINVLNSSDSSCFNATKEASPSSFTFSIEGEIAQCNNIRFSMDGPTQGLVMTMSIVPRILTPPLFRNLQFQGVIPGGQSFQMDEAENPYTFYSKQGSLAFNWTVSIRGGSEFIIIGGDSVGIGSGGHSGILGVAASGYKSNNTCINNQSPSSTAGSPAGGIATGTSTVSRNK